MLFLVVIFVATPAIGGEIYKCTDPEGNVAYVQTPCPAEKEPPAEPEPVPEVEEPVVEEVLQPVAFAASNKTPEEIEECKAPLRGEVDEIYAALNGVYAADELDAYKTRLRTLTEQMRLCE